MTAAWGGLPLRLAPEVAEALAGGAPLVALETSIVAQGLPSPQNLEAALGCEAAVRAAGAVPATVAVLDGELRVGLAEADLERLAGPGAAIRKLSARDLGPALAAGATGATTVAGTVRAAAMAGSRAVPSRRAWMNESRFHCQSAARIAAAAWNRKAAKHNISKRLSGEP